MSTTVVTGRSRPRRRFRRGLRAAVVAWGLALTVNRLLVRIDGASMAPTLHAGQYVLGVPAIPGLVREGAIVVVADPRDPGRMLAKRIRAIDAAGVWLAGDNPAGSTDSRVFGAVAPSAIRRVVVARLPRHRRAADSQGAGALGGGFG